MPLVDLVRNLNHRNTTAGGAARGDWQFIAAQGRVFAHYANLRLESAFLAINNTQSDMIHGHAAALRVQGFSTGLPVTPEDLFALPESDGAFIDLDRKIRTLHALNYLIQPVRGDLFLEVHPRHIAGVADSHGLAFEDLLHRCGLIPAQITLEIELAGDRAHLQKAIANYRSRGYGIAIGRLGSTSPDFDWLESLHPDAVKLDPLTLASSRPLKRLIDRLHDMGAKVIIEGDETRLLRKVAASHDIDLLQSCLPVRRLVHASPTHGLPPAVRWQAPPLKPCGAG